MPPHGGHMVAQQQQQPSGPVRLPDELVMLVGELLHPGERRVHALEKLIRYHNSVDVFGFLLWHTPGVMAALVQEITFLYPMLDSLTKESSGRCCNTLAMLQGVASNADVRIPFVRSQIFMLVYPFLAIKVPNNTYMDNVRVTALGVIGALVRMPDPEVIEVLLQCEIFPLCLSNMDSSVAMPAALSTLILLRLLSVPNGMHYVTQSYERFYFMLSVLARVAQRIDSQRLARYLIGCYAKLAASVSPQARLTLRQLIPPIMRDDSLLAFVGQDDVRAMLL